MTAIACTSRMRSTSSTSTSMCFALAHSKARWRSTRVTTCPRMPDRTLGYLNALWTSYQGCDHHARKLPADAVANYVADLSKTIPAAGGNAPAVALKAGLVTGVKTRLKSSMSSSAWSARMTRMDPFVRSPTKTTRASYTRIGKSRPPGHRIGVIVAEGEILDGDQAARHDSGESTARLIRNARMTKACALSCCASIVPAAVSTLRGDLSRAQGIQSCGQAVDRVHGQLRRLRGYYISAPADEIWASPATVTGSIGIFAIIPTVPRTLAKVGVNVTVSGTTPLSGNCVSTARSVCRRGALLQSTVERGYEEFLQRVQLAARRRATRWMRSAGARVGGSGRQAPRARRWARLI